MIPLSGQLCKLIPHIIVETSPRSMSNMRLSTHLILTCILSIIRRGKKWISHNTTGKRVKTTPQEIFSTWGGKLTISMVRSYWDFLNREITSEKDQTQCLHTTQPKKKMMDSFNKLMRQKLISVNLEPLIIWPLLKTQLEWRHIKFITLMINTTKERRTQEVMARVVSWQIDKIDLSQTPRKLWPKRESKWSSKCCRMKKR